ncbi:hypothetical protein B0183_03790 [Glaesserella parasuis]|uniref:hypothetical protein n=1 Tax=Glaesserella parasuis TaxID=738 RepID=UPI000991B193|nr:hypothetical protein [Glaesserella parasuis]OOR92973.1 hypothetical protein B0183_03790 [Glaesserella parasuis]STO80883.1 Uncharacterised protein [Glaesserella parasuis]
MFDANVVTAVCAVLGIIGGFVVWVNNIIQSRMPDVHFTVSPVLSSKIYRITLYPKRIKFVYVLEEIQSLKPLYTQFKGVDILGRGNIELDDELDKKHIHQVVQSCHQKIDTEPFIEFFVHLKDHNKPVYQLRLLFKSEHFPFRWGKRIVIPVG